MLSFRDHLRRNDVTKLDDLRKAVEATIGNLTPGKAQDLAKSFLEPGARKEQVAKTAADLIEWSQRNRERLRTAIRREIADQMQQMGVATRSDLDAVKKRVRDLERAAGMTASGRAAAAKNPSKRASASRKTTSRSSAKRTAARPSGTSSEPGTPGG
jgi:polyhydroxyalkanoate synthesis regulator phasin